MKSVSFKNLVLFTNVLLWERELIWLFFFCESIKVISHIGVNSSKLSYNRRTAY